MGTSDTGDENVETPDTPTEEAPAPAEAPAEAPVEETPVEETPAEAPAE